MTDRTLHIYPDPESLSRHLAEWIVSYIGATMIEQEQFTWVLTGGSSPKRLYELLSSPEYASHIPWERLHIFWGDERAVPFDDERNNARMAFEALLNKVPVPRKQIHIMDTSLAPELAADAYDNTLKRYFPGEGSTFDLVLNGMGDDGHTLSLFPGTAVIHETSDNVSAYYLEAQKMHRITLTAPIVNRASAVLFLCFGAGKAKALKQVLEGPYNPDQYPSQVIKPVSGDLHWFVDEAAAGELEQKD